MDSIVKTLAQELNLEPLHVEQVVRLLDEGKVQDMATKKEKGGGAR